MATNTFANNIDLINQNVEIRVIDAKKNRSMISKRNVAKGEIIFSERPIICAQFSWNEFYNYKACEYCMKPLENVEENVRRLSNEKNFKIMYPECCETNKSLHRSCPSCNIEYCSEECRVEAFQKYHKVLCLGANRSNPDHPINVLIDTWRQMHLPPETTTIMLIIKLIAMMKQADDKNLLIEKLANFECDLVNESQNLSHKLLSENFFNQIEYLRQMTYQLFKEDYLYTKECEPFFSEIGFKKLFGLIGRNSQGVGTSPLSVWVNNCSKLSLNKSQKKQLDSFIDKIYDKVDDVSGQFLNSEGSALYEYQSMANHSCAPNAEITYKYNNNVLTIVALDNIKEGQEILISYLDECNINRSRHSRQKVLKENYLFVCECERCLSESNQPDVTSEEEDDDDDDDDNIDDENNSNDDEDAHMDS